MVMNGDGSGGGVDADVGSTRTQLMIWRLCNKCCPLFPIVMPPRPPPYWYVGTHRPLLVHTDEQCTACGQDNTIIVLILHSFPNNGASLAFIC